MKSENALNFYVNICTAYFSALILTVVSSGPFITTFKFYSSAFSLTALIISLISSFLGSLRFMQINP